MTEEENQKLHKDGLGRDVEKLGLEWDKMKEPMKPHVKRWLKKPFPHEYTNLWVEGSRVSPYFMGHVATLMSYALLITAGLLVWRW